MCDKILCNLNVVLREMQNKILCNLHIVLWDMSDEILCNLNSALCYRTCTMKSWSTSRSLTRSGIRVMPSFSDPVTHVSRTTWCNSTPSTRLSAPHPRWDHSPLRSFCVCGVVVVRVCMPQCVCDYVCVCVLLCVCVCGGGGSGHHWRGGKSSSC